MGQFRGVRLSGKPEHREHPDFLVRAGSSLEPYSFDVDHKPDLAFFELGHVGLELELKVRIIRAEEMARILGRSHDDRAADEGPSVLAGNVELECIDRGLQSCPYQLGRNHRVEEVAGLQFHRGHVLLARGLRGGDLPRLQSRYDSFCRVIGVY